MKRIFILGCISFLLILLLIFGLCFSFTSLRKNNKALMYFNSGNFKTASEIFSEVIEKNSSNNDILINLSGSYYRLNEFDKASSNYSKVIRSLSATMTDKFIAYYDLGNVEFKQGKFKEAVDLYKESLKINSSDYDTRHNFELALKKLNEKNSLSNQDKNKNKDVNQKNKKAQDLKKQIDKNDKDQEKNEKQQHEESDKPGEGNQEKSKCQKDLKKEKQKLDQQRQEISDQIKDLQNEKINTNKKNDNTQAMNQDIKDPNKENQDTQTPVILNYYNESDKNTKRPKKNISEFQVAQTQEDW